MSVGLLIVAHERIARAMVDTADSVLGACPLPMDVMEVSCTCDPEVLRHTVHDKLAALDQGQGVLVLTDLYGSTPSNIAADSVNMNNPRVRMVAGLNVPMLLRIMNYADLGLDELAAKAVSGGHDGVFACEAQRAG